MFKFVFLLAVSAGCAWGQTADYCATSLCNGSKHIACGNNGAFASTCAADKKLIDISSYKSAIVAKHNGYRNTVAAGNLPGFLSAVRMGTMQWDDELASLAALNVKQCAMKHDACRNTDRFKWSGQNLAWYWSIPAATVDKAINNGIESWFNEYKDATMAQINSYSSGSAVIGHFTPIVNDRNIRVGCALLSQGKNNGVEYFFACNYAQTNVLNRKIYTSGTTASQCTTGTNPSYPALCSVSEPIDPNVV
ncbi:unnamed protein product [Hermetia illucens]|uniref:Venom allergen-1 n=1 Tax=Hermetia illucens TaxID=343691 RepID=A0A7R8YS07_HERIL|nr:antigen 5 like allergen Cul n 1-like [Hermetia illucens]CAD7083421.1 unnamed protein product [Hermetia illucens]